MIPEWFKPRHYQHLDRAPSAQFISNTEIPSFVSRHQFSPLIHYVKGVKRYKPDIHKTNSKNRPIMYASHRDACILSYYSYLLGRKLSSFYELNKINDCSIAYRATGKGNYDFSAETYAEAVAKAPCVILAFDVTGFFDNLDHKLLKSRIKLLLGVARLSDDWQKVFSFATRFSYLDLTELKRHPIFQVRIKPRSSNPIGTIAEVKAAGITLKQNGDQFVPTRRDAVGIAQGTPVSATLSNVFMIDFDVAAKAFCDGIDALYRRYSDDILVICKPADRSAVETKIQDLLAAEKLQISAHKTEVTEFDGTPGTTVSSEKFAQYLGFTYYRAGPGIRPNSIGRQHRKMRRAVKRALIEAQRGNGVLHTRKLRRRFQPIYDIDQKRPLRNFSSYAQRSASAFGKGNVIRNQAKRFEAAFQKTISDAKDELK